MLQENGRAWSVPGALRGEGRDRRTRPATCRSIRASRSSTRSSIGWPARKMAVTVPALRPPRCHGLGSPGGRLVGCGVTLLPEDEDVPGQDVSCATVMGNRTSRAVLKLLQERRLCNAVKARVRPPNPLHIERLSAPDATGEGLASSPPRPHLHLLQSAAGPCPAVRAREMPRVIASAEAGPTRSLARADRACA